MDTEKCAHTAGAFGLLLQKTLDLRFDASLYSEPAFAGFATIQLVRAELHVGIHKKSNWGSDDQIIGAI